MNKIVLALCVMLGSVCYLHAQITTPTTTQDLAVKICSAVAPNKLAAIAFLKQLSIKLASNGASQKFPRTVEYVTAYANAKNPLDGGQPCQNFISGLQTVVQTDLANNGETVADGRKALMEFLQNNFPQIANLLGLNSTH